MTTLSVALLGAGSVGAEVATRLIEQREYFAARVGQDLELIGIAVRDTQRERPGIPQELLTTDATALVARADIVIELMGGIEPARALILQALANGASVVTANKALLAQHGTELRDAADAASVRLEYEAAVAGAIPIIRPVGDSLAGDAINKILGIVNGTTNFILDKMDQEGSDFDEVLAEAQALGFAEADPTADVGGADAAAKAAILASLAFHTPVSLDQVHTEGITSITADMIADAREQGYVIKLLAICERVDESPEGAGVSARVYPALIPRTHALASVHGAFNAVFVEAEAAGELMFYGQGAGGQPTASAVLGDVVSVARRKVLGGRGQYARNLDRAPAVLPIEAITTRYQITLQVQDRFGVLSAVTEVFAQNEVSIEAVRQTIDAQEDGAAVAKLVISTHAGTEAALAATVARLEELEVVTAVLATMRMEGQA